MSTWTSGYVADIGYTYGYYGELNPLRLKLAFLNSGLAFPDVGTACELGFGQGLSANIHAAASTTTWHGTDFNPSQAAFAQELSAASGADAHLLDDAFADFCARPNLPDFDYIGLHGIWSWISDANRAVIVDFVRRKLKVGGVLYISYNTLPGWASFAPMRHLLTQHAATLGVPGQGIVNRINGALGFADQLLATNPLYARANPSVAERLKGVKAHDRHYLAHEYFNQDWHPMYFADMAQWLEPAKLQFACSAHYVDQVAAINLTAEQQKLLAEIPDANLRETVRDYMVNQQFRRDYWVKGARKLNAIQQVEKLRQHAVLLASHRLDVSLNVTGALGEAKLSETIYNPLLDALADHKPQTLGQLEKTLANKGISFSQIMQATVVLAGGGHLVAVQGKEATAKAKPQTTRLNAHILHKALSHGEINYLASPMTGGGFRASRFEQLFLLAMQQGHKQPADWAKFTWDILNAQGQKLVKEGTPLATAEENMAELTAQAQTFAQKQLPVLKALQVV